MVVFLHKGQAVKTEYTFLCENWLPGSGEDIPLEYRFYSVQEDGSLSQLAKAGTTPKLGPMVLEVGKEANDYNNTILIEVTDVYGASSTFEMQVQVGFDEVFSLPLKQACVIWIQKCIMLCLDSVTLYGQRVVWTLV